MIYLPYIHCHPNKLHLLSKTIYFGRYTNYIDIVQEAYPRHPGEFAPEVWYFWIPQNIPTKHQTSPYRRFQGPGSSPQGPSKPSMQTYHLSGNLSDPLVGFLSGRHQVHARYRISKLGELNFHRWKIHRSWSTEHVGERTWKIESQANENQFLQGGYLIVPGVSMVLNWGTCNMVVDDRNIFPEFSRIYIELETL